MENAIMQRVGKWSNYVFVHPCQLSHLFPFLFQNKSFTFIEVWKAKIMHQKVSKL